MDISGARFAIVGALDALTRRLARKGIASRGGVLRHSMSKRVDFAVFGHGMVRSWSRERIGMRVAEIDATDAKPISENALLAMLGLSQAPEFARSFPSGDLIRESGLAPELFRYLVLFDAFDFAAEPFGMRDLIAARQYANLLSDGVPWPGLIQAARTRGRTSDGGLAVSNVRLERSDWNHVVMRVGDTLTELDGQHLLPLRGSGEPDQLDRLMDEAEEAEARQDWWVAAALYRRCVALDPENPLIPFNLGCVLIQQEDWRDAANQLHRALKLDPGYAEAWYNLGSVALRRKDIDSARRYLKQAVAADPGYADPVYNLALLEYESGAHAEAARLWRRYLELDPDTDWSKKARRGLRLIRMLADRERASGERRPAATAGPQLLR